jgi:hypothetical protein
MGPTIDHVDADGGIEQVAEHRNSEGLSLRLFLVSPLRQKVVTHARTVEE